MMKIHTTQYSHLPDPGFIAAIIDAEINLGAGLPGIRAVVMIMSLSLTHLAIA